MTYQAPIERMRFAIERVMTETHAAVPALYAELTPDLIGGVLESAGRFAQAVLAPLNTVGDRAGARLTAEGVCAPPGFRDAYAQLVADGWPALAAPTSHGGQGLPALIHASVSEMWSAANHAFAMCPELAVGAALVLERHAAPELRELLLPRVVSGQWATTMALSEPRAGSDLANVATVAEPDGERWRLRGQKIYVSWGEHDLTENIVHFVLARTPDAPPGSRGLSLFAVPRYLCTEDGRITAANDLRAVSLERKMGIHGSPTCAMALGERDGACGWLVGQLHRGLECMFTLMNHMRLGVGLQAIGIAEHATQIAVAWARERVQGRDREGRPTVILNHPDVRRMLLAMHALTDGSRALAYTVAGYLDLADHSGGSEMRADAARRADLLTPVVKAWCSEAAIEVTSLAVQVLGGAGYLEDTLAAQLYRDVRITAIYEGTNGIQAQDLLGRKVLRDGGAALQALIDEMVAAVGPLVAQVPECALLATNLHAAIAALEQARGWVLEHATRDRGSVDAVAVDFLQLVGYVCVGWQWACHATAARRMLAAGATAARTCHETIDRARFYGSHLLPRAALHAAIVLAGAEAVAAADAELL